MLCVWPMGSHLCIIKGGERREEGLRKALSLSRLKSVQSVPESARKCKLTAVSGHESCLGMHAKNTAL